MVRDLTGGYLLFSPHSKNNIVYKGKNTLRSGKSVE